MIDDSKSALLLVGWLAFLFVAISLLLKYIFNFYVPLKNILLGLVLAIISLVLGYSDIKLI
ncbi:MAG: hypothetical protein ACHQYO_08245 [Halanaerobiales bacterium]